MSACQVRAELHAPAMVDVKLGSIPTKTPSILHLTTTKGETQRDVHRQAKPARARRSVNVLLVQSVQKPSIWAREQKKRTQRKVYRHQ